MAGVRSGLETITKKFFREMDDADQRIFLETLADEDITALMRLQAR